DGIDAWLLIAPTKGINVWCAAGGGHFSADTVISIIRTSGIEKLIDHRVIILPQLSAAGINSWSLKERTGWNPRFGPVDIKYLGKYLQEAGTKCEEGYRRVQFPLKDRFVMGTNLGFNSLLFLLLPFLIVSVWVDGFWWKSIPLVFLLAVLNSVLVFFLPGKPGVRKGFSLGIIIAAFFAVLTQIAGSTEPLQAVGWTGWILLLSTYIGYDMPSWSPLWRADVKELILGKRSTRINIIPERCIACGLCTTVCPANVFTPDLVTKKSAVSRPEACQACGACILNCPNEAITSNFQAGICSCPTCAVINTVKTSNKKVHELKEMKRLTNLKSCCESEGCGCNDAGQAHRQ
ncbi:MAG: 4Fe-4S dicluster domain-containing protein, partial [FCB group bacterium]|nr:4Fe-4S dicluster domain-containing protein [FCB group bacterium]